MRVPRRTPGGAAVAARSTTRPAHSARGSSNLAAALSAPLTSVRALSLSLSLSLFLVGASKRVAIITTSRRGGGGGDAAAAAAADDDDTILMNEPWRLRAPRPS